MPLAVWTDIRQEAKTLAENEPILASFFHATILKHHNLGNALSYILANKLANTIMPAIALREIIEEAYQAILTSLPVLPVISVRCVNAIPRWNYILRHCYI